jgi:hypothetical protein
MRRLCLHNLANWDVLNASTIARRERHLAMLQCVAAAPCSARFARRICADDVAIILEDNVDLKLDIGVPLTGLRLLLPKSWAWASSMRAAAHLRVPQLTSASGRHWSGEWGNSPIGKTNHVLRSSNTLQCTHAYAVVNVCSPAGRPSASRDPSVSGSGHGCHDVYCRI